MCIDRANAVDVARRFWETVYGARGIETLREIVADDFEPYDPTLDRTFSAEDVARVIAAIHADIPEFSARIEDLFLAAGSASSSGSCFGARRRRNRKLPTHPARWSS